MTKDMTQGSPLKLILAFAVPLMLGSLFQQFYNLADTIIVGRFVGVDALAAVGSVGGLNYLVLGFVNGIACGFSIPISWTFGAKDYREMRRYTANTVWLSLFFRRRAHGGDGGPDPGGAGLDQHPRQHHRHRGHLHPHHLLGHPLYPAVQRHQRPHARAG